MAAPGGRRFWVFVLILFAINVWVSTQVPDEAARLTVPYTFFREQAEAGNVAEVTSRGDMIQGEFRKPVRFEQEKGESEPSKRFETQRPSFADDELFALLLREDVEVNARPLEEGRGLLATIIFGFGPTLLLVALFIWLMRRAATNLGGGLGAGLGRSRAKRYEASEQRTTFADVAGIEEAEEELVEIVDFLKNPDRYRRLGGAIPKGVLLSGPPGTGKTLWPARWPARPTCPSSRCRPRSSSRWWWASARAACATSSTRPRRPPAIIFIDELDAIGRARGGKEAFGDTTSASRPSTRS